MKIVPTSYLTTLDVNITNNKFKLKIFPNFFFHYIKNPIFKFIFVFFGLVSISCKQLITFNILYLLFEWSRVLVHEVGHAIGFLIFAKSNWIEIELKNSGGGSTESKFANYKLSDNGFIILCLLGPVLDLVFSLFLSGNLFINYGQAPISIVILLISIHTLKVNIFSTDRHSDGYLIFQTIKQKWVVPNERTLQLLGRKDCH